MIDEYDDRPHPPLKTQMGPPRSAFLGRVNLILAVQSISARVDTNPHVFTALAGANESPEHTAAPLGPRRESIDSLQKELSLLYKTNCNRVLRLTRRTKLLALITPAQTGNNGTNAADNYTSCWAEPKRLGKHR